MHALSVIRTQDPGVRESEDSSCSKPRGQRDRLASERAKTVHALDRAATVIGPVEVIITYTQSKTLLSVAITENGGAAYY
jgi:translation initiation factor 2B subunit (eIF-2B alpha/beta/delta family)